MSEIQGLGLSGFRSYASDTLQKIEFETPLTLIWGKNGSGKTTIIEVLKFITTGCLPPSSDKGKNFLMEPKLMGGAQIIGDVRLKFKAFNGRPVLAKRRVLLTNTSRGSKFESLQQVIKTKDTNGQMIMINHQCAQIQKQIPALLGITRPVLDNIIFCHQDESLWPFSDSTTLKNIFDQMFETKKYSKIMEAQWEQAKELQKNIKIQIKNQHLLQRLCQDDMQKKQTTYQQSEAIKKEAYQALKIKAKLDKCKQQLKVQSNQLQSISKKKFELVKIKGSMQQKIKNNQLLIQELTKKTQVFQRQYVQLTGSNINLSEQQICQSNLQKIAQYYQTIQSNKKNLTQLYEQQKNNQLYTQKEMQIKGEIKRARQALPQLKKQNISDDDVLIKLKEKCEKLQQKKSQLVLIRNQKQKIMLPGIPDASIKQRQLELEKQKLNNKVEELNSLHNKIIKIFSHLYRKTNKVQKQVEDSNIEQKLQQIQVMLKLKKQELQHYKSMPNVYAIKQKRFKLHFSGIQMYQTFYSYCTEKGKCSFCSRSINQQQLKAIQKKCKENIGKTQNKLVKMDAQLQKYENVEVDPQKKVKKLQEQISKLREAEKQYSEEFQKYKQHKQKQEQIILNEKLLKRLSDLKINPQYIQNAQKQQKQQKITYQLFQEYTQNYFNLKMQIQSQSKQIRYHEERQNQIRTATNTRNQLLRKKQQLTNQIASLQEQTKNYDILNNVKNRLSILMRGKIKGKTNRNQSSENQSSIQDLKSKIYNLDQQIRETTIKKQIIQIALKIRYSSQQKISFEQQIAEIDSKVREYDNQVTLNSSKMAEYNNIHVQYQTKKRQVQLKSKMLAQLIQKKFQKQIQTSRTRIRLWQQSAKRLQQSCKDIQICINQYHKQKMDQINKIIHQIWKQIYHGDDIDHFQIRARIEEDSKKKKNYDYSIVMKRGQSSNMVQMKGRCSMGQKVLVSIVIRLALGQTFSSNARILALDEPTTNLDRQHIENLADELSRLIEVSQEQSLQMIIITHDIEFIKRLENFTSNYHEVTRDSKGFSRITKKQIKNIYEKK